MTAARLVLADDHAALVAACRQLLQPEFEVVASVGRGVDALAAVTEHDPDVLVLDLEMPDLDGIEVLEALQARPVRTRVVVLTLHRDPVLADRVEALGAAAFVTKADMVRDLPRAVRAALAGEPFTSSHAS